MPKRTKLLIKDGAIFTIYDDDQEELRKQGQVTIARASNVEPDAEGGWTAAMRDGATLGSYPRRADALAAEVDYLTARAADWPALF